MPTTAKPPHQPTQRPLFQPLRPGPSWEAIPRENRHEVEQLLARLLREYASRCGDLTAAQEGVGHE